MELVEKKQDGFMIRISKDEAVILNNALNEICHGIEIFEFQARIGGTEREAKKLLLDLSTILDSN